MGRSSDLINRKAETYREYVTFTRKNRNENQEKNVFENIGSYIYMYVQQGVITMHPWSVLDG